MKRMAKLANFEPAKMPVKRELGQLGQLFFRCVGETSKTLRHLVRKIARLEPRPPEVKARTGEVGQVGQLRTCRNACKKGTWPTWPTFFRCVGGTSKAQHHLVRKIARVEPRPPEDKARTGEVGQVGQLRTCKNSCKKGSWPTLPT